MVHYNTFMTLYRLRLTFTATALSLLISLPFMLAGDHIHDSPASEVSCVYCGFSQTDWINAALTDDTVNVNLVIRLPQKLHVVAKRDCYRNRPRSPPILS